MSWKSRELGSAKRMGGKRIPITGRTRGSTPDHTTGSGLWAIEYKSRKKLPAWIYDAMDQAVKAARGDQYPLVILHQTNQRLDNDLMIVRRKDFERIEEAITQASAEAGASSEGGADRSGQPTAGDSLE